MTQRGAVFVGCRLIAIYLVVDSVILIAGSILQYGYMLSMAGNSGRMGSPFEMIVKNMGVMAVVRGGVAVLLWGAAGRISRAAADPEDGDDGLHGG